MDHTELQKFLVGRFQDVMEVLAIVIGAPSIARETLNTLSSEASGSDSKTLIARLKENLGAVALSSVEGEEVVRLFDSASPDHLVSLRREVPLVSRFSFETQSQSGAMRPRRTRRKAKTATV
jgi:hypothetical protein